MTLKNLLIKWLITAIQPMKRRRFLHGPPRSFLLVSTTGLGDTLWAGPALETLRTHYPDSLIALLTHSLGSELLSRNKALDEVFILEEPLFWNALRLLPTLKRCEFDMVLLFHSSQRFILPLCSLMDVPQIIGTKGQQKGLDFLLTDQVLPVYQHEVERRLSLVQAAGVPGALSVERALHFPLHQFEEEGAKNFLSRQNIPDHLPLIGLHPGAKNKFKQWPPHYFVEVGKRLVQHTGCQIIVSGDGRELQLTYEVASQIPGAIPLAGELSIGTFAALLKRYHLFITGDTGPMHLAFAVKTPTVALFSATDPALCGPWHNEGRVALIYKKRTCSPCLGKKCEEPFCLLQINPDLVYEHALELFFHWNTAPV